MRDTSSEVITHKENQDSEKLNEIIEKYQSEKEEG